MSPIHEAEHPNGLCNFSKSFSTNSYKKDNGAHLLPCGDWGNSECIRKSREMKYLCWICLSRKRIEICYLDLAGEQNCLFDCLRDPPYSTWCRLTSYCMSLCTSVHVVRLNFFKTFSSTGKWAYICRENYPRLWQQKSSFITDGLGGSLNPVV